MIDSDLIRAREDKQWVIFEERLISMLNVKYNNPYKDIEYTKSNEQTKSAELYPLEDETKVDEWRKELGLEPLATYLEKNNIKFQPKQK